MEERAIAVVFLCGAGAVAAYAILGRLFGFHRPAPWSGGGHSTLTAEMAMAGFLASIGLFGLVSPAFIIPALACSLVGARSQANANRKYAKQEKELRERNAKEHPGVFDCEPPQHLDLAATQSVDVYDRASCVYLGRIGAAAMNDLVAATADMPDQGPNDIFVIEETLEPPLMQESVELKAFLREHFESRGYAILRWFPAQTANNRAMIRSGGGRRSRSG